MMIADIKDYLETNNIVSCDIYLIKATQRAIQSDEPYLTITRISHSPSHAFGGDSGYHTDRIQFTVHAPSYLEVNEVLRELKGFFAYYNNADRTQKMGKTWVQATLIVNEITDWTLQDNSFMGILDVFFIYIDHYLMIKPTGIASVEAFGSHVITI